MSEKQPRRRCGSYPIYPRPGSDAASAHPTDIVLGMIGDIIIIDVMRTIYPT